jgi:hypothetical protein
LVGNSEAGPVQERVGIATGTALHYGDQLEGDAMRVYRE